MRNMLEIQKGVDMKMWKYSERRYESECEDDNSWNKKGLIKVKMRIK